MMKTLLNGAFTALLLLIYGGAFVQAAPAGRIIGLYIGTITLNNGNGPVTVGIPDSIAYTYSGSRAVYDLATTYELDTLSHTSKVIGYDYYTYTAADSFLTEISQTVTNGVTTNNTRLSRAYNAAGTDTLILSESWNATASAWVPSYRTILSFNPAGQRTGVLQQSWNATTSAWLNLNRTTYQYDAAGRDSATVRQKWVAATSSWKNVTQNLTHYTSFNKIATIMSQRWSDTTAVFKDSTSAVNYYNSSNYLVSTVRSPVYENGLSSATDSLATLTVNAAGSPLVQVLFDKSIASANNPYIPNNRYTYSYNAANQILSNQTELIDNNFVAYNSLTGFYEYNSSGQNTLNEPVSKIAVNTLLDKEHYRSYYEATTAIPGSPGLAAGGMSVYPSPAASYFTITSNKLSAGTVSGTVADVAGRIWMQWSEPAATTYSKQISVASLPVGIYYVRLSNKEFTGTSTLIIQH